MKKYTVVVDASVMMEVDAEDEDQVRDLAIEEAKVNSWMLLEQAESMIWEEV